MIVCRNCKYYSLIRPFDKDDLRMLAKVAGFFSNQASQRIAPFELTPGQWQVHDKHTGNDFVLAGKTLLS